MLKYDFTQEEKDILSRTPDVGLTYQRYITIMNFDDSITAYRDDEWQALEDKPEWDEYVYQFAVSKEAAVKNHTAKIQLYREMADAEFPDLHTY